MLEGAQIVNSANSSPEHLWMEAVLPVQTDNISLSRKKAHPARQGFQSLECPLVAIPPDVQPAFFRFAAD
jgi:hypothetical protein